MAKRTLLAGGLAGAVLLGALAGCVPTTPTPVPTQTEAQASSTPVAPSDPVLVEGGTAKENQAYFDKVNRDYIAVNGMGFGLNLAQNLVDHGFRKQDLEVTADKTAIDLPADSIIVALRIKGECLIADFHAETYSSAIMPLLGTGACLIGTTVAIP